MRYEVNTTVYCAVEIKKPDVIERVTGLAVANGFTRDAEPPAPTEGMR